MTLAPTAVYYVDTIYVLVGYGGNTVNGKVEQAKDAKGNLIPNKWYVRYDLPAGPNGDRRQKKETVNGPKRNAQARLAEVQHTRNTGEFIEPNKLTLGEWLEFWLKTYAEPKLTARSYQTHETNLRTHIIPKLGGVRLHELTTDHLQSLYVEMLKTKAPATVARVRAVVSKSLNQAVKLKKIGANPNRDVELKKNLKTERTKEMIVLTEEQLNTLLEAAKDTSLYIEVLLGATSGLRLGEVLAMKFDDVNWDAKPRPTIRVDEAAEFTKAKGNRLKGPKSESGVRTIPLSSLAIEPLRREQVRQTAYRSEVDPTWNPTGLVCPRQDGGLQKVHTVSHYFANLMKRVSKETGVPAITFHQLRHTMASLMLHQGTPIAEVSRILGHANITITLLAYAHLIPGADTEAVARFDEHLRRAQGT